MAAAYDHGPTHTSRLALMFGSPCGLPHPVPEGFSDNRERIAPIFNEHFRKMGVIYSGRGCDLQTVD